MLLLARIFFARQGRENRAYLGYVRFCLTRYSGKKTAKITFHLLTVPKEVKNASMEHFPVPQMRIICCRYYFATQPPKPIRFIACSVYT